MDTVDVVTRDLLTADTVDPADTASARPTTQAADTVDALLLPTTATADVDVPQAPTGKLCFRFFAVGLFTSLLFLCGCHVVGNAALFFYLSMLYFFVHLCALLFHFVYFYCKKQYFISSDMTKRRDIQFRDILSLSLAGVQ